MHTLIQIRNVPSHLHRRLKAKGALSGQSLSSHLLSEIERLADYDAAYVALAEALPATLLTQDQRLAKAPSSFATIEVIK